MSRIYASTILALAALQLPAAPAIAQVIFAPGRGGGIDTAIQGRATTRDDIYTCQAAPGGSRIRENCEVVTEIEQLEQQQKMAKLLKPPRLLQCGASTTTEFRQLDTIARVNGTLEIRDCGAASGTVTIAVVVKDESGAQEPREFTETWQRDDERDVSFSADYPIGEKAELVDVRLSGLTCTCTDPFAQPGPPAAGEGTPD
ncbi:MAG TPA: hypothetical protein VFL84_14230 [Gammaproteobacteria bacterium]|nr:hypothetical protein [Gammaproteobacteria bacterium]